MQISKCISQLLSIGIPMQGQGINNWALTVKQAKVIIRKSGSNGLVVLGGDILILKGDKFNVTGDNWFCEPNENEGRKEYLLRSINTAITYLDSYPFKENQYVMLILD